MERSADVGSQTDSTLAQQRYADSIYAYRLAEQHSARVAELHEEAIGLTDKLRVRMEEARRALYADQN